MIFTVHLGSDQSPAMVEANDAGYTHVVTVADRSCSCARFRQDRACRHLDAAIEHYEERMSYPQKLVDEGLVSRLPGGGIEVRDRARAEAFTVTYHPSDPVVDRPRFYTCTCKPERHQEDRFCVHVDAARIFAGRPRTPETPLSAPEEPSTMSESPEPLITQHDPPSAPVAAPSKQVDELILAISRLTRSIEALIEVYEAERPEPEPAKPPKGAYDTRPVLREEAIAKTLTDLITPKQLGLMRSLAHHRGLDLIEFVKTQHDRRGVALDAQPEELTKQAASWIIGLLEAIPHSE